VLKAVSADHAVSLAKIGAQQNNQPVGESHTHIIQNICASKKNIVE